MACSGPPAAWRPTMPAACVAAIASNLPSTMNSRSRRCSTGTGSTGFKPPNPWPHRRRYRRGSSKNLQIPLRQAGTFLCDLRLLGDSEGRPARALALIVGESETLAVDRDEIVLLEDWRLRPDGTALAPGGDARDASRLYTINGESSRDIPLRRNERLRLRVINGFQRTVIAVKIESFDIRVMALDSQPAEPFLARNGALLLAPGARIDAFIDATAPAGSKADILLHDGQEARPIGRLMVSDEPPLRAAPLPPAPPLPANPLPARLDLKNALRFELVLGARLRIGWPCPASRLPRPRHSGPRSAAPWCWP